MGPLRVALLGDFRATAGDDLLVAGGAKQRAVLAILALGAGQVVPEARLIDGIWGDQTPSAVRGSLQVYVAHWRRVLAQAGCEERIERHGSGYLLTMEPLGLDVRRVETLAGHGRAALAEERYPLAAQRLTEALAFWRGDTLHDFVEMPFHLWESVAIETMRTEVLADRIDALLGSGGGGELIPELEALVLRHPYEERFRGQLMHALYRAGRQVDAVRACTAAREVLGEIGLDIGPGLRRMEQRVLQQDPDLDTPVSPFPPAAPPEPLSTLIGRDDEVETLVHAVVNGESRLLTLTGPGGVGKSRLALEVAHRVAADGWMPVAFTALGDSGDRAMVTLRVNEAFGVPDSWRERPTADIARMLGRSPVLVVIDGAEHLLEDVQSVVSDLLQNSRQIRVMVTSRSELGLVGESVHEVTPLRLHVGSHEHDVDGADHRERVRQIPSVALFVERAERALSVGDLSDEGLQTIVSICRAVDGLPLAIELAAARVGTLGLAGLQRRLGGSLDVLSAPRRPGVRRHQSLREVISWSYELLTPEARALLAVLSVLPSGFTVEHAEALVDDNAVGTVLDAFEELARHSLISRVASDGLPVFRMLDTVRAYARERLAEHGRTETVYRRLVGWVEARLDQVGGRMGVGAQQFEPLDAETENARAAMNWLLVHGTADEAGTFCERLYVWWMFQRRRNELELWLESAIRASGRPAVELGTLHYRLGVVLAIQGRIADSSEVLRPALTSLPVGSLDWIHASLFLVENTAFGGEHEKALAMLNIALADFPKLPSPEVRVRMEMTKGIIASHAERFAEAAETFGRVARLGRESGWIEAEAKALAQQGGAIRMLGDLERSFLVLQKAYEISLAHGLDEAEQFAAGHLALTSALHGEWVSSLSASARALELGAMGEQDPSSVARACIAITFVSEASEILHALSRREIEDLRRDALSLLQLSLATVDRVDSAEIADLVRDLNCSAPVQTDQSRAAGLEDRQADLSSRLRRVLFAAQSRWA